MTPPSDIHVGLSVLMWSINVFVSSVVRVDSFINAGINLTSYHPPGTPELLHQNVCPAPGLLHNRKCPEAGPINDDVPGAGHLHQLTFKHENC